LIFIGQNTKYHISQIVSNSQYQLAKFYVCSAIARFHLPRKRSPPPTYIVNKQTVNKLPYCMWAGRPQARSYTQQHKPTVSHIE